MAAAATSHRAEFRLRASDLGGTWHSITFTVERLLEFRFNDVRHTVLSDGLGIHLLGEAVFLDLEPYIDLPYGDEGPQAVAVEDLRKSDQYLLGERCSYELTEYREDLIWRPAP